MSNIAISQPPRTGQATAIEQSRAYAEVQASVVLARQSPRDVAAAEAAMRVSCSRSMLAERAFFKYKRGDTPIQGESVYLARELARCWGHMHYGIAELSRDDVHGQSEMLAFAWDLQTNARSSTIFIVPHRRDARGQQYNLVDLRDIYENNANAGARRLREMILSVLPPWFVEEAKDLCSKTLERGQGQPLNERIAEAIAKFAEIGISEHQLTHRHGRRDRWTAQDIAKLQVTYRSIQRGEVSVEDEFPDHVVTLDQLPAAKSPPPPPPATRPGKAES